MTLLLYLGHVNYVTRYKYNRNLYRLIRSGLRIVVVNIIADVVLQTWKIIRNSSLNELVPLFVMLYIMYIKQLFCGAI